MEPSQRQLEVQEMLLGVALHDVESAAKIIDLPDSEFADHYQPLRNAIRESIKDKVKVSRIMFLSYLETQNYTPSERAAYLSTFHRAKMHAIKVMPDDISQLVRENQRHLKLKEAASLAKAGLIDQAQEVIGNTAGDNRKLLEKLEKAKELAGGSGGTVNLIPLSSIKAKPVQWLFQNRIPMGKVTLFGGDGGVNKSTVAYDLAARVSVGGKAPLSDDDRLPLGDCILVAGDDDPETDIIPRLDLMGADTSRIYIMDIGTTGKDGKRVKRMFDLADIPSLRSALEQKPETRMVVIDPVSAFVGKKDANKHADVYGLMQPLGELAARFGVALILIAHTNKASGTTYRNKVSGSTAWTDAARACYLFSLDPKDPDRRFMSAGKINAARKGKALAFRIIVKPHPVALNAITIEWESEVDITADQLLQQPQDDGEKIGDAKTFLLAQLANGSKVSSTELQEAGEKLGISKATLWRAKEDLSVKARKVGMSGGWAWYLDITGNPTTPEETIVSPTDEGSPF